MLDNLIISDNKILLDNINANSKIKFDSEFKGELLGITIIDQGQELADEIKLKSQNIITIQRPTRLSNLMKLIDNASINCHKYLFCHLGKYIFDEKSASLKTASENISLTEKENDLLKAIITAKASISKKELLESIWQQNEAVDSNTVESHIYTLRKKLGEEIIINNGNGYEIK